MKHAGPESLDQIEPLLQQIRRVPGLIERSRGVFYKNSRAFLHFHEDPSGMHADIRRVNEFERYRVETPAEQSALLELVRGATRAAGLPHQ
jgi:hypothetical protein